jgi:hypothetical protein
MFDFPDEDIMVVKDDEAAEIEERPDQMNAELSSSMVLQMQ